MVEPESLCRHHNFCVPPHPVSDKTFPIALKIRGWEGGGGRSQAGGVSQTALQRPFAPASGIQHLPTREELRALPHASFCSRRQSFGWQIASPTLKHRGHAHGGANERGRDTKPSLPLQPVAQLPSCAPLSVCIAVHGAEEQPNSWPVAKWVTPALCPHAWRAPLACSSLPPTPGISCAGELQRHSRFSRLSPSTAMPVAG